MTTAGLRRIAKELEKIQAGATPIQNVEVLEDASNHQRWNVKFTNLPTVKYPSQDATAYLDFPADYPFKPPTVTFDPPIEHDNVNVGVVASYVYAHDWNPTITGAKVLESVHQMLIRPIYSGQK